MTHVPLVRAVFGAVVGSAVASAEEVAAAVDVRLMPGQVGFITGPSGAGKSTILGCLRKRLRGRGGVAVDPALLPDKPVVDCLGAGFDWTLNLLAMCGLSEGPILARRASALSTGQRWRLALAVGLHRVRERGAGRGTLLVDEFGSSLDRASALCLCRTVRRFVTARQIRAVCASHDDGLMEALGPALLVVQPLHAAAIVRESARAG
jgi:ABC-type hemin transport system ATPase subunit